MTYPDMITLEACGGDPAVHLDAVYDAYIEHLVRGGLSFLGKRLSFKHLPATDGRGYAFWHAIQEQGETAAEEDRIVDLRRCERIAWPAWMIRNAREDGQGDVLWWETIRSGRTRVVLWLKEDAYAVVLEERSDFYLFWTTYTVRPGRGRKFEQEHVEFWAARQA